jgi:hypothetical protein
MVEDLILRPTNGNFASSSYDDEPMPKIFLNPNHKKNAGEQLRDFSQQEKILAQKLSSMNAARPLHNSNEFASQIIIKSVESPISKKRNFFINLVTCLIVILLIANLVLMLDEQPARSINNAQSNQAILEFENVVPMIRTFPENETSLLNIPNNQQNIDVPKKRVLVISEDKREEILHQLNQK